MLDALIALLVVVIVVGIVYFILVLIIDKIPMDGSFKQIAKLILLLICVLIVLMKALPLLGVSVPL